MESRYAAFTLTMQILILVSYLKSSIELEIALRKTVDMPR